MTKNSGLSVDLDRRLVCRAGQQLQPFFIDFALVLHGLLEVGDSEVENRSELGFVDIEGQVTGDLLDPFGGDFRLHSGCMEQDPDELALFDPAHDYRRYVQSG